MNHDKMRVNDMLKKTLNEREPFSSEISGNTNIYIECRCVCMRNII